jgi:hypothetical protein
MPESFHKLTDDEVRFLIKYAVKMIPAATLQDLHRGSAEKRATALEVATDVVIGHLARAGHEIRRPERSKGPLFG